MAGKPQRRDKRKPPPQGRDSSTAAAEARRASEKGAPKTAWWYAPLLIAVAFLIYYPALHGPFILDDYDMMESNSSVRTGAWNQNIRSGRPLLMLTFIANYRLDGFEPLGFHVVNVLLHALNAIILWRFLAALLAGGKLDAWVPPGWRNVLLYGVPLLFLTSPIQTESVAYISSRSELLAALFYLLALWLFVSRFGEEHPWLSAILIGVLFVCAALSKQDKLTLPAAIVLTDYLLLSGCDWRRMKRHWRLYAFFAVGSVAGFFLLIRPILFSTSVGFSLPWKEYLFTQFRVHFLYLKLLFVPFGLNLDPDIAGSASLGEHFSWLALVGLIAIAASLIYIHRRARILAFGGLFYFLVLAPTSSFFPILDFAAERRLYLPSVGFFIALATGLMWLWRLKPGAGAVAFGLLGLVYCGGTFARAQVWSDGVTLWEDTVAKSPEKARPLMWLGKEYEARGEAVRALELWERAAKFVKKGSEENGHLLNNIALAYARMKNYDLAVKYYQQAVAMIARPGTIWANLAVAQMRLGREEEAWKSFDKAVEETRASSPEVFKLRGQEYFLKKRYEEAAADFQKAVELNPDDEDARYNLAGTLKILGRTE